MTNQQFLKKRHIGPGSDCENMVRPDIVLMGRKNKMTGVISIMEQNGVEAGKSLYDHLPKEWTTKHGLQKGQYVRIDEEGDALRVLPWKED